MANVISNVFKEELLKGNHDFDGGATYKIALYTSSKLFQHPILQLTIQLTKYLLQAQTTQQQETLQLTHQLLVDQVHQLLLQTLMIHLGQMLHLLQGTHRFIDQMVVHRQTIQFQFQILVETSQQHPVHLLFSFHQQEQVQRY